MSRTAQVTIRMSDGEHSFAMQKGGSSVLDAAEAAGILLPSQCRAGLCATCRARTLSGEVHMETNLVLEPEELEAGYILMCQSRPTSDELVLEIAHACAQAPNVLQA